MQNIINKAKSVKLLLLDVDGILTNGIIYYNHEGADRKGFHVHDGLGIKLLHDQQIKTGLISAKHSHGVEQRAKELGITYIHLGHTDKLPVYEEIKKLTELTDQEIAYMGDDLPDLAILRRVGFAITVPQAPAIIQEHVDLVTTKKAGKGAVREACEFILKAQGRFDDVLSSYLGG